MTECNRQPLLFSSLDRKKVQADFAGGTLTSEAGGRRTSDAGGLLLREVDRQLGLIDALAGCLTDPRDPARVVHDQRTMLAQRVFALASGYEDLDGRDELRHDPLLAMLAERTPQRRQRQKEPCQPLASSPTLCRLENRVDRKALARMSAKLVDQFIASFDAPLIASFDTPPDELVLDFDPTDVSLRGEQQRRFFRHVL